MPSTARMPELSASVSSTGSPCAARKERLSSAALSQIQKFFSALPCPTPLPEAAEAGVFGQTEAGPVSPDESEVREITEEHARQMVSLFTDLSHLVWCDKYRLDPRNLRPIPLSREETIKAQLAREIAEYAWQYQSCVDVYPDSSP